LSNVRANSSNVNKNILLSDLKLTQYSNTTIFKKSGYFFLSPSVQNDHWWFDIRKVNIDKFNTGIEKGYLLIRLLDKFLICKLENFIARFQMIIIPKPKIAVSIGSSILFYTKEDI
jgi:hypothetical protein